MPSRRPRWSRSPRPISTARAFAASWGCAICPCCWGGRRCPAPAWRWCSTSARRSPSASAASSKWPMSRATRSSACPRGSPRGWQSSRAGRSSMAGAPSPRAGRRRAAELGGAGGATAGAALGEPRTPHLPRRTGARPGARVRVAGAAVRAGVVVRLTGGGLLRRLQPAARAGGASGRAVPAAAGALAHLLGAGSARRGEARREELLVLAELAGQNLGLCAARVLGVHQRFSGAAVRGEFSAPGLPGPVLFLDLQRMFS